MSEQPTVAADTVTDTVTGPGAAPAAPDGPYEQEPGRRRTPDVLTLLTGLVCLVVALMAVTGWSPDIRFDPRWLLAGGAVALGTGLLVSSIRSGR